MVGGVANAIREHGNGGENHVTGYAALAVFGLGMVLAPVFMKGRATGAVAAAPDSNHSYCSRLSALQHLAMGESRSYEMEFGQCLGFLAEAGGVSGQAPVNLVETSIIARGAPSSFGWVDPGVQPP